MLSASIVSLIWPTIRRSIEWLAVYPRLQKEKINSLTFELRITLWSPDDPGQICVYIGPEPIDLLMDNIFLLLPMHRYTAGTNWDGLPPEDISRFLYVVLQWTFLREPGDQLSRSKASNLSSYLRLGKVWVRSQNCSIKRLFFETPTIPVEIVGWFVGEDGDVRWLHLVFFWLWASTIHRIERAWFQIRQTHRSTTYAVSISAGETMDLGAGSAGP